MPNLLCLLGRHRWVHHVNPEVGGPGGTYDLCSRCHKERKSYETKGNPGFSGPLVG